MQSYLKKYEVTITTKGPLYIGSGKNITKKEYYFDEESKKVYFFDFAKMFKGIIDKGLEGKYQDYMFMANAKMDLGGFFKKNGISLKEVKSWADYSIDASNIYDVTQDEKNSFKNRGINTFIKESGNRNYIPGSSLKGAIRTAILSDELSANKNKYSKLAKDVYNSCGKRNNEVGRNAAKIESSVLNTMDRKPNRKNDAVNDVMASVRVSDSEVIDNKNMALCQRMDQDVDGNTHNLPIYYECVKPGASIKTTITIDTSMKNYISIDRIKQAISNYSYGLFYDFTDFYSDMEEYNEEVLFIGGYSGFPTKTIAYPLLGNDGVEFIQNVLHNSFKKHEHLYDSEDFGISPRMLKVAEYGDNNRSGVYEVGKVEIKFKEVK